MSNSPDVAQALAARPLHGKRELTKLIRPESVVVIGATKTPGSFGQRTMANMRRYTGRLYGINPKYTEIESRPCFPDLASVPEIPDCAVLCVPFDQVLPMLHQCGQRGVGAAIVYASGFAETGTQAGIDAEAQVAAIARQYGMRIAGPNCVGLTNVSLAAGMHFMPEFDESPLVFGKAAIVSQSGALGYALFQGMNAGIGFSHSLAAGNSCDIDICDYVSYLAEDDETTAIACILEGVRDGARFIAAGRKVFEAGKTLIVYKTGRGEASRQVAMSHTGSLIGSTEAYEAALHRMGAISVDSLDELIEVTGFFSKVGLGAAGDGVGVLATSGGAAVVCADKAQEYGVALPDLAPQTEATLHTVVPDFGRVANPTDTTGQVLRSDETFSTSIRAFLDDPGMAALVVPMVFASRMASEARIALLGDLAARYDKPIVVIWMNAWLGGPGAAAAAANERLTIFHSTDHCFRTLGRWFERSRRARQGGHAVRGVAAQAPSTQVADILASASGACLTERESKMALAAYGVPTTKEMLASDTDQAVRAAAEIGYPVAVKIESADIAHKTDAGVIRLDIHDESSLRTACDDIVEAARRYAPSARVNGILVQQMVPKGVEVVVGCRRDEQFGMMIMVGLGGTLVEVLRDTVTRLAPVDAAEATEMLRSLRSATLFDGHRGQPPVNLQALAQAVSRVSQLGSDFVDSIAQIDVNPVIALEHEAIAVDALFVRTDD